MMGAMKIGGACREGFLLGKCGCVGGIRVDVRAPGLSPRRPALRKLREGSCAAEARAPRLSVALERGLVSHPQLTEFLARLLERVLRALGLYAH